MTATRRPGAPVGGGAAAPLSVAQEALWYRAVLTPTALTYNEAISIHRDGPLDVDALCRAFNAIVDRHAAWHTTFDTVDGKPVQIVGSAPEFELPVLDLCDLGREQAEQRAAEVVAETARVPYDVRRGPLLRPRLIRFASDHHRLYLAMHHLIFDGVSLTRVVLPELSVLYQRFATGGDDPRLDEAPRYGDFARWEQAWVDQPRSQRRREHWRRRLGSAPSLSLALDHPRPSASESRGGALALDLPVETVERLRELALEAGGTLFQAFAAAWALMLAAHAGQDDVVFAVAADMRQRPEFEALVGCALTTLAVRLDLSGDPTFLELVERARNELLDGLDNVVPFERLVRDLKPDAEDANPIYQTMLVLEPASVAPDLAWSLHQIDPRLADAVGVAKLDLELQLDERSHGAVVGQLIYDRDLFERSTVARLLEHWLAVVAAASTDPAAPISRLSMLTATEEVQLRGWNATRTERRAATVHELVSARARSQPESVAVCNGAQQISYAELDHRSDAGAPAGHPVIDALAGLKAGEGMRLQAPDGKIVEVTHAGAVNGATALAAELAIGPADTILVLPGALDRAPILSLWMGLIAGARIVLAPAEAASDGSRLRRLIRAEQVTFLQASPNEWEVLIDTGLRAVRGLRGLSASGTDGSLSCELAGRILERCRVLWNAFGMAETSGYATLGRVQANRPVTIGRPLANTRAHVVDCHDRQAPVGVPGELLIAGDGVACGYLDDDGDERFIGDPFGGPGRAFRTGVRGRRRADGQLELAPRFEKATTGIEPV